MIFDILIRYMGRVRNVFIKLVKYVYIQMIVQRKQAVNFWVLMGFIYTFTISRLIVYLFPNLFLHIRGVHIHHFAYGFIILAITGILSLNEWNHKNVRVLAFFYGIGLGLSTDEFGMWIQLEDDYWIRHSYDALFIVGALLISIVYFAHFWKRLFAKIIALIKLGKKPVEELFEDFPSEFRK